MFNLLLATASEATVVKSQQWTYVWLSYGLALLVLIFVVLVLVFSNIRIKKMLAKYYRRKTLIEQSHEEQPL